MHPGRSFAEKGQMGAESNKVSMDTHAHFQSVPKAANRQNKVL